MKFSYLNREDNVIIKKTQKQTRRRLEDLTLKDNFLFTAVMSDPDNCKSLLEIILNIEIERVVVDSEKSIINHPEYRSVRLDVYAKDEENTRYNIEMQVAPQQLEKRTRYYHSQMDLDILSTGVPYEELPDSYVIFVCDFDPFGRGDYQYTVRKNFREEPDLEFDDASYTIFLSTKGTKNKNVSEKLVEFLKFLGEDLPHQKQTSEDSYIRQLQNSIEEIKRDRFWSDRYMLFGELIDEEKKLAREEGRAEGLKEGKEAGLKEGKEAGLKEGKEAGLKEGKEAGLKEGKEAGLKEGMNQAHREACNSYYSTIFKFLARFGAIPDSLQKRLSRIDDLDRLSELVLAAGTAESLEAFEDKL